MSKIIERKIECPFYISEGNRFITCEGILKGTKCEHKFSDNDEKNCYEENICSARGGKMCQHYRSLSLLYERGIRA